MKSIILITIALSFGYLNAQSESKIEKKFERFENGELVEDQYYLEENGNVINGRDFEIPNIDDFSSKMDFKMAKMDIRMNKMRSDMDQRMLEMKNRALIMRNEFEGRISERKSPKTIKPELKQGSKIKTIYS